jgi:hypothetical protein
MAKVLTTHHSLVFFIEPQPSMQTWGANPTLSQPPKSSTSWTLSLFFFINLYNYSWLDPTNFHLGFLAFHVGVNLRLKGYHVNNILTKHPIHLI